MSFRCSIFINSTPNPFTVNATPHAIYCAWSERNNSCLLSRWIRIFERVGDVELRDRLDYFFELKILDVLILALFRWKVQKFVVILFNIVKKTKIDER